MKKSMKAGALALSVLALAAFTGCSVTVPTVTPYWYNAVSAGMENTAESIHYKVALSKETDNLPTNQFYSVDYTDGSYSIGFYNTTFDPATLGLDDVSARYNGRSVYCLETSLSLSGKYTLTKSPEESKEFTDSVESICYFLSASDLLFPVYSRKTVKTTSPAKEKPNSLEECFVEYEYRTVCDYGAKKYSYTDLLDAKRSKTGKIEIPDGLFIDNEELFLLGRGLNLSAANKVQVFSPYTGKSESVVFSAASQISYTEDQTGYVFKDLDKAADVAVKAVNQIGVYRDELLKGNPLTVYYASRNDSANYRNAMIALLSPLPYGLGYLEYTLTEADFCDR